MRRNGADYSLKLMVTGIHDLTRTPSFVPGEKPERRTVCTAASMTCRRLSIAAKLPESWILPSPTVSFVSPD